METETDGGEEKKGDAIKHSEPAMAADDGMKEDGAEAVPEGVKGAAAHAPAAEGVPQPVPNVPPPDAEEDEMEGWMFVPKKKNGADWHRVSLMVKGGSEQEADKLAKFLFNCATHAKMSRLPNAANNEGGQQIHRYQFVNLMLGGKERRLLNKGMVASDQHGWVATPPDSDFAGLEYRVDKAKKPSKVGATPGPVRPIPPPAPKPAAKNSVPPRAAGAWASGEAYHTVYPPLQQPQPMSVQNDAAYKQDLQEVRNEVQKMGLLVEKLLSCREADQNLEMSGANSLLRKEMADLKEENGKMKEEQLRAAAAAAAAEKNRLAQLAAQTKTHSVQMEKLEQALAELRARLEETITQMKAKNAEIKRLVDQREAAAQKYCTPNKQLESKQEDGSDDGFYRDYNFDDESSVDPADPKTLAHLTWLAQTSSKKKSKQQVKLHKRQGATPLAHQSPVSGRPRSRDQVEPTGQTPEQLKIRSKMEERPEDRWDHYLPSARMPAPGQTKSD